MCADFGRKGMKAMHMPACHTKSGRTGVWLPSVTMLSVSILASLAVTAEAANVCWSPADLAHSAGEEKVVQETPRALVRTPQRVASSSASPFAWHGALRRVDLPPGHKLVALTFDLCEQPHEVSGYQGAIVDFLRAKRIPATFFAGGKWMLTHRTRSLQLIADPLFEMANHAWEHRNLRLLSGTRMDDEIQNASGAYAQLRGELAKAQCTAAAVPERLTLFRFPFGACNAQSLQAVESAGLRAIQWDVSSSDPWKGQSVEQMTRDVVRQVRPGSIVLFHANGRGWNTDRAIPAIVDALAKQGYKFVTVGELLKVPGAKPVVTDTCYDSKPGDTDRYDALARSLDAQHANAVARIRQSAGAGIAPPQMASQPSSEGDAALGPPPIQPKKARAPDSPSHDVFKSP